MDTLDMQTFIGKRILFHPKEGRSHGTIYEGVVVELSPSKQYVHFVNSVMHEWLTLYDFMHKVEIVEVFDTVQDLPGGD